MMKVLETSCSSMSHPWTSPPHCVSHSIFVHATSSKHDVSVRPDAGPLAGQTYERWNEILRRNITAFLSENEDVTTMVLSSWDFFNLVFKTPSEYGFEEGDIHKRYGPVWADHIHPTSRMHECFAARVNEFLSGQPAGPSEQLD